MKKQICKVVPLTLNYSNFKMDIQKVLNAVNEDLEKFNFGTTPNELYEPARYILAIGGKRLRPLLVILGHHLFSDNWEDVIRPSVAVEIFHNFTLMHDDIMDAAPLRRGEETVHTKWNNNTAILSGDAMLIKAYKALDGLDPISYKRTVQLFNKTAVEVCEGQQYDMNFETRNDVSESEYIEMIRLKTAVLLGFSLELGSILAGATKENTKLIRAFGEEIGIGFQLKDDILDVFGDASAVGKQVGGDIISNKKTFLLIKALEKANAEQKAKLEHWINRDTFEPKEKVEAVTAIYNEIGINELSNSVAESYFEGAFQKLQKIDAPEDKKALLKAFSIDIMNRIK